MTPCRLLQQEPFCLLAAAITGAASTLAFAPFQWWPIALVSASILLWLLTDCSAKQAFLRGWSYGFGFFLSAVSWVYISIHEFGAASIPVATFLTVAFAAGLALFFALHALSYQLILRFFGQTKLHKALIVLLIFPALWVLAEWFRSWFLTGFPWTLLGYAPMDTWLSGWAPIIGVYGLSYFSALAAAGLVLVFHLRSRKLQIGLVMICTAPFVTGLLFNNLVFTSAKGDLIDVVLVQGNTAQNQKWNPGNRQAIYDTHLSLTLENLDKPLIIWPETAIPELLQNAQPRLDAMSKFLAAREISLLTGIPSRTDSEGGRKRYHNSVIGIGEASGIYHKQRLVPFGEYVPLESMLRGLIAFFDLPMSSFSLGPENQQPISIQNGITIAPYICYEIVYPDLVAAETGNILLTVSNDTWFGDSLAPHQHLQMARMRAIETGRYLMRATNNGISAIINEKGVILAQAPQFVATVLTGTIQPMQGHTPYSRTGSWPILLFCLALILSALILSAVAASRMANRQD